MRQDSRQASAAGKVGWLRSQRVWPHLGLLTCAVTLGLTGMTAGGAVRPALDDQHPAPNHVQRDGQGQHLGDWLQKHQDMSPLDQQNALRREPGFNRLPTETQQRLIDRLQKLNNLPPGQRQRTLSRMEAMEHLSPPQRDAVRKSAQQLGELPQDRQRMVRKAFRDLRDMPGEQRDAVLNSPRFQGQFSPQEREILGTLLKVEPYQGGHSSIRSGMVPAGR